MGFVYHARERATGRDVALKLLPRSLAADPAFVERFDREARTLARLDHPGIVRVYGHGQSGGFCHLTMEYVDGANLRQAMRAGRFTPAQALLIVPLLCDALHYAHSQGVLHRDIKPENILLDSQGRVKIADFGIAKLLDDPSGTHADITLTQTGHRLGTPHYMAPEQVERPGDVDHRADIYSLGVVFYELLTGELPLGRFAAPSTKAYLDQRIDDIVFRALAKERELRQQSAGQVREEVEGLGRSPEGERVADPGVPLATSPCFVSNPAHLRSILGQLYIYSDRGTVTLERDRLLFSGRNGLSIVRFQDVLGIGLGEYPRLTKPTGLSYIALRHRDEAGEHTFLLTPYHSQWDATWTTNSVVQQWHQSLCDRITATQGRAPAGVDPALLAVPMPWKFFALTAAMALLTVLFLLGVVPWLHPSLMEIALGLLGLVGVGIASVAWMARGPRGTSKKPPTRMAVAFTFVAIGLAVLVPIVIGLVLLTTTYRLTQKQPPAPTVVTPRPLDAQAMTLFGPVDPSTHPGAVLATSPAHSVGGALVRTVSLGDGSVQDLSETDFLRRLALGPTNQYPAIAAYLMGPSLDPKWAEKRLIAGASLCRPAEWEFHELEVDLAGAFTDAGQGRFDLAVPPLHALLRVLPPNLDRDYLFNLRGPNAKQGPDFHENMHSRDGGLLAILVLFAARAGDAEILAWAQAQGRALWTTQAQLKLCARRLDGNSDQDWEELFVNTAELLGLQPGGRVRTTVVHRTMSFGLPPRTNVVDMAWPRLP
jgi:predicted Ser/Thr protein kinase